MKEPAKHRVLVTDAHTTSALAIKEAAFQALRERRFTIRGECVSVAAAGDQRRTRLLAYDATSRALATTRRVGYRWQSALKRRGVKIPKALMAIARRVS